MDKQTIIKSLAYLVLFIIAISFTIGRVYKSGMQKGCESVGLKLFYRDGIYKCDNLTRIIKEREQRCINIEGVEIESLS